MDTSVAMDTYLRRTVGAGLECFCFRAHFHRNLRNLSPVINQFLFELCRGYPINRKKPRVSIMELHEQATWYLSNMKSSPRGVSFQAWEFPRNRKGRKLSSFLICNKNFNPVHRFLGTICFYFSTYAFYVSCVFT